MHRPREDALSVKTVLWFNSINLQKTDTVLKYNTMFTCMADPVELVSGQNSMCREAVNYIIFIWNLKCIWYFIGIFWLIWDVVVLVILYFMIKLLYCVIHNNTNIVLNSVTIYLLHYTWSWLTSTKKSPNVYFIWDQCFSVKNFN